MAYELETPVIEKMHDVTLGAGEQIVHAKHVVPLAEQALAKNAGMAAFEPFVS